MHNAHCQHMPGLMSRSSYIFVTDLCLSTRRKESESSSRTQFSATRLIYWRSWLNPFQTKTMCSEYRIGHQNWHRHMRYIQQLIQQTFALNLCWAVYFALFAHKTFMRKRLLALFLFICLPFWISTFWRAFQMICRPTTFILMISS